MAVALSLKEVSLQLQPVALYLHLYKHKGLSGDSDVEVAPVAELLFWGRRRISIAQSDVPY